MPKVHAHGLSEQVVKAIQSVFAKHAGIKKAVLYGSRAKGNHRPGSDIDIALIAPDLGLTELLKIETDLDELSLPYKIDLSLLHLIENQDLLDHIQRVGVEFYRLV